MTLVTRGLGGGAAGDIYQFNTPITGLISNPVLEGVINLSDKTGYLSFTTLKGIISGQITVPPYYWPPTGDGATEVWRVGAASGDFYSEVQEELYTELDADDTYYGRPGPTGTQDVESTFYDNDASDKRSGHGKNTVSSTLKPGTDDFQLFVAFKSKSGVFSAYQELFILVADSLNLADGGFHFWNTSTTWYLSVLDSAGNEHNTTWASSGAGWEDDTWYFVRWYADRSLTKARLWVDGVEKTTGKLNDDLSSLGTISPSNINVRLARNFNESSSSLRLHGNLFAVAYAKNLTYIWPYWS